MQLDVQGNDLDGWAVLSLRSHNSVLTEVTPLVCYSRSLFLPWWLSAVLSAQGDSHLGHTEILKRKSYLNGSNMKKSFILFFLVFLFRLKKKNLRNVQWRNSSLSNWEKTWDSLTCQENTILQSHLFISVFSEPINWVSWIAHKFALKECDVETRRVVVDKLE